MKISGHNIRKRFQVIFLAVFIMLSGIPGSGKSTLAGFLAKRYHANLISTDEIRLQLTGSEEDRSRDNVVFATARQTIRTMLQQDKNVIFDATNLSRKDRKKVLHYVPAETFKKCYYKKISLSGALIRNAKRKRVVPEQVIINMYQHMQPPTLEEGWDEIEVIHDEK